MRTPEQYRANDPKGKAFLHAADYEPPHEEPDEDYPLWLTTGRVVYHFHTRTKTGRAKELNDAAPDVYAQLSAEDASNYEIVEGDMVKVESRRGQVLAHARIGDIEPGHVFIPFHYGYWDEAGDERPRAANEMTLTEWDPVSKQPHFKYAAVRISKNGTSGMKEKAGEVGKEVLKEIKGVKDKLLGTLTADDSGMHVAHYLGLLRSSEEQIADAFTTIADHHGDEPDIYEMCVKLASWSRTHTEALERLTSIYGEEKEGEAEQVRHALFQGPRAGGFGLLRDLHDLYLLVNEAKLCWMILLQAGQALRDKELEAACTKLGGETDGQLSWLQTRIKQAAPQALVVH